jgi:hypothetical protein
VRSISSKECSSNFGTFRLTLSLDDPRSQLLRQPILKLYLAMPASYGAPKVRPRVQRHISSASHTNVVKMLRPAETAGTGYIFSGMLRPEIIRAGHCLGLDQPLSENADSRRRENTWNEGRWP